MTAKLATGVAGLALAALLALGVAFWSGLAPGDALRPDAATTAAATAPLREELHAIWLLLEPDAAAAPDAAAPAAAAAEARSRLGALADRLDRAADPLRLEALLATLAGRLEGTLASLGQAAPPPAPDRLPETLALGVGLLSPLLAIIVLLWLGRARPVAPAALEGPLREALEDTRRARGEAVHLAARALDAGDRAAAAGGESAQLAGRLAGLAARVEEAAGRLERAAAEAEALAIRQEAALTAPEASRLAELLPVFEAAAGNVAAVDAVLQRMAALAEDRDKGVRELLPLTIGINELMRRLEDQAAATGRATIESGQRIEAQALAGAQAIRQAAVAQQQETAAAVARIATAGTEGLQQGATAVREASRMVAQAAEAAIARIGASAVPAAALESLAERLEDDAEATEAAIARLEAAVPRAALEALAAQLARDSEAIASQAALRATG